MKTKNMIIVALVAVILLMAVGYAAFAQLLDINGTANISADWNVKLSSITEQSMIGAVSKSLPNISNNGISANFDVDLKYPGASATYQITVQNAGTIDAILESVDGVEVANAKEPTDILYSITAVTGDILTSGSTKTYMVTVIWKSSTTAIPNEKSKTATISLNYVQNT